MDIRNINTRNWIINGLIQTLTSKKWTECKTIDIIEQAEISKKTFYNYYKNKEDLLHQVEHEIVSHLSEALAQDRQTLKTTKQASTKDFVSLANSAFDETLHYCDEHKDALAVLLSNNGDINLYHAIVNLANREFVCRMPHLFGVSEETMANDPVYVLFQTIYVDSIINLLIFWLNHRYTMSVAQVKHLAGIIQTKSSVQLMQQLQQ